MPKNPFAGNVAAPTGLALDIIPVIPANADVETVIREVRVGSVPAGADVGTLRVSGPKGTVVNLLNVKAGDVFPGPFHRIHATGTTVTDLVGWI